MASSCLEDDTVILFSTSNSPEISSTTTSSSSHPSPPPHSTTAAYKLTVRNLSYTLHPKNSLCSHLIQKPPKPINILKSVSFVANTSQILAIVGPSGTGKSTLLRIVSGRVKHKDFNQNSIYINSCRITSPVQLRKTCSFVAQEDDLLPLLTVKETLMYSAMFRLRGISNTEQKQRVQSLIQELGLIHVQDNFVGDEEHRGISGGEKKRVSIGIDLIHDPPILILDEPTSGLDSTSALQVIEILSSMAKAKQRTVVLSIHQPSYRILQYIPNFLILSRGSVAFHGSLDSLEETIIHLGFQIPVQLNSLEFSMEIISILKEKNSNFPYEEIDTNQRHEIINPGNSTNNCLLLDANEVKFLCSRFWKILYRTKQLFLARTMQSIVGGFGLASVFVKVKNDKEGIVEKLGLFAFSLSFLLSSTVEALPIYLQEQRVLMKESSRGAYRISSYIIANTIVFLPFLLVIAILFATPVYFIVGLNPSISAFAFFTFIVWLIILMANSLVLFLTSISPDFISGNSLISSVLGIFFLFSGYFIPKENIPWYWKFMYYGSLYKYGLDSMVINEYWSLKSDCFSWEGDREESRCLINGNDVLKSRGLDEDNRWMNVAIMVSFFVLYRAICWVILAIRASRTIT